MVQVEGHSSGLGIAFKRGGGRSPRPCCCSTSADESIPVRAVVWMTFFLTLIGVWVRNYLDCRSLDLRVLLPLPHYTNQ